MEFSAPSATPAHSKDVQEVADSPEPVETAEGTGAPGKTELEAIAENLDLIDIKKQKDGGYKASIKVCPRNRSHDQGSAWLYVTDGGAVKAGCYTCRDFGIKWDWYWLRDEKRKELGLPEPDFTTAEGAEPAKAAKAAKGSDGLDGELVCSSDAHDGEWFADGRLTGAELLDAVADHLSRYVVFMKPEDAWYFAVWTAHTHAGSRLGTTPRVKVSSPIPGAGKSTCGQHLEGLSHKGVKAASFSSEAAIVGAISDEPRTIILDEFEKAMAGDPRKVQAAVAIINDGYRVGGARITSLPNPNGGWRTARQNLFAPVAIIGNAPPWPDDTMQRTYTVLLMPDWRDQAEESTWDIPEFVDSLARLGRSLHLWIENADLTHRPDLPDGVKGRMREKWLPLARVAHAAGGEWPKRVWDMAAVDLEQTRRDMEEGLVRRAPHIVLLQHIVQDWPAGESFWATEDMLESLKRRHAEAWGPDDNFKAGLTATRLAKMLRDSYSIRSEEESSSREARRRGYRHAHFGNLADLLGRSGFTPTESADPADTAEGSPGTDSMKNHLLNVAARQGQ